MKVVIRFSIVTVILLLVTIVELVIIHRQSSDGSDVGYAASLQIKPCVEFLDVSATLSFTKKGEPVARHSYMASDGISVNATYVYYHSQKKANKELNRKLKSAIQIIKSEPKLNEKGRQIGIRVVGIFGSNTDGVNAYEVLWTDGSDLNLLRGKSLPHLLQLEAPNCLRHR